MSTQAERDGEPRCVGADSLALAKHRGSVPVYTTGPLLYEISGENPPVSQLLELLGFGVHMGEDE